MKLRNLKPTNLIICLVTGMAYPTLRTLMSESNRFLHLIDSMTIIALALIIVGVFYSMVLKGDFDISTYVAKRSVRPNQKPFEAFKDDKNKERESSFNYPLFTGIIMMAAAIILTFFYSSAAA